MSTSRSGHHPVRVLVIEDDDEAAELIVGALERERFQLERARTGPQGLNRARTGAFDLVIADWSLPGLSGDRVVSTLRAEGYSQPIIMLTGRNTSDDEVIGLTKGADDYMTKPFNPSVLRARVRAHLWRRQMAEDPQTRRPSISLGALVIDPNAKVVRDGEGGELRLTSREYEFLFLLTQYRRSLVDYSQLAALGHDDHDTTRNGIHNVISRLRKKLGVHGIVIDPVSGRGYRLYEPLPT